MICCIASGNWGSTSCYENQARLQQTGDRDGTVEATAPGYRLPADAAEPTGVEALISHYFMISQADTYTAVLACPVNTQQTAVSLQKV